jgi:hypothetical protein
MLRAILYIFLLLLLFTVYRPPIRVDYNWAGGNLKLVFVTLKLVFVTLKLVFVTLKLVNILNIVLICYNSKKDNNANRIRNK